MVERRRMIETAVGSQKIVYEPRVSEGVCVVAISLAHTGEIWDKPVHLQVESAYTLKMHDGALT